MLNMIHQCCHFNETLNFQLFLPKSNAFKQLWPTVNYSLSGSVVKNWKGVKHLYNKIMLSSSDITILPEILKKRQKRNQSNLKIHPSTPIKVLTYFISSNLDKSNSFLTKEVSTGICFLIKKSASFAAVYSFSQYYKNI